jgi:hypothetical protein
MPKIKYAKREAKELKDWLDSRRIENVRFPTTEPAVDIIFENQLFIRLDFSGPNYTFNGSVQIRDRKHIIGPATEITRQDTEVLLMAYNILESDATDGFIRACGEHVKDLWQE